MAQVNYVDILNAAWAEHLKPRAADAPTVIGTFTGGGGSSLGFSMAGYRELLAVEWNQNAVDTFRLNLPDIDVYHGDVATITVDECLQKTGLAEGELDVFQGSPPCQGFSTAGKRNIDDGRNQLFREYVRLLRGLKPKAFVMENVSGMVKGNQRPPVAPLRCACRRPNPRSKAPAVWVPAGAATPVWACRSSVPLARSTARTTSPPVAGPRPNARYAPGLASLVGVGAPVEEEISGRTPPALTRALLGHTFVLVGRGMKLIFADIMRELKASGYQVSARLMNAMYFNVPQSRQRMIFVGAREDLKIAPTHPLAQSSPLDTRNALASISHRKQQADALSSLKAQRWKETIPGKAHHKRFSLLRLAWDKTPGTVLKVPGSGGHMHPDEPRLLNIEELQRLGSFPDPFDFVGNWLSAVERIGNSVPPLLMRAIALHIKSQILDKAVTG